MKKASKSAAPKIQTKASGKKFGMLNTPSNVGKCGKK
jgi:hypothetical protein